MNPLKDYQTYIDWHLRPHFEDVLYMCAGDTKPIFEDSLVHSINLSSLWLIIDLLMAMTLPIYSTSQCINISFLDFTA